MPEPFIGYHVAETEDAIRGNFAKAIRRWVADEVEATERAAARVFAVLPTDPRLRYVLEFAVDEYNRRLAMFERLKLQTPSPVDASPKRLACESVYEDLIAGRIR